MIKIAICGRKQHGKSTVAKTMAFRIGSCGGKVQIDLLARPLKKALCVGVNSQFRTTGLTFIDMHDPDLRMALWGISNWLFRKNKAYLVEWMKKNRLVYLDTDAFVIDDLRRPFEAEYLHDLGFTIVKVIWPSIPPDDPAEDMVDLIDPDYEIVNDGTLDELKAKALEVLEQIHGDEIWENGK